VSKIGAHTLLLSAVPLTFLVVLLVLALVLQSRNAIVARQSQRLASVLSGTDRAMQLVANADRSIGAYQHSRNEAALAPYRKAAKEMPGTLSGIVAAIGNDPVERAYAARMSADFTEGISILDQVRGYIQTRDITAEKKLIASPRVQRLNSDILSSITALDNGERLATAAQFRQIDGQMQAFTIALVGLCVLGIVVTIAVSIRFGLGITRRIGLLAENARRLARGEKPEPIGGNDEISQLDTVYQEMTHRIQREHHRAAELQRALLPQVLPSFPGIRLDATYRPATGGGSIGGDWYDVFRISEHSVGISIGDVAGHGLQAAALMGSTRQAIRTVAYIDDNPATVVSQVNRALCRSEDGIMVTALFATFDLLDGSLRYCLAGHPAPIVVRTDGSVGTLEGKGLALGVDATAEFESYEAQLEVGSALVLFTDGLVEAERDYLKGMADLERAVEEEYRNASHNIAEAILNRIFARREPSDDSALLFIGVTAHGAPALPHKRRVWNIDARIEKSARRVKRALLWHLGEIAAGGADLSESEVVVSELLGNVARHTPGPAEVTLEWKSGIATVSVFDRGRPFEPPAPGATADLLAESGRGLILLRALARSFTVEWTGEGNCVSAVLPINVRTNGRVARERVSA
jgi:serine phosphatase RsbU (regulator of sigma subunit)/CHASE3 domain sensor protein/anti-sigma regulatory factor (Ser/Thr protein kinase)